MDYYIDGGLECLHLWLTLLQLCWDQLPHLWLKDVTFTVGIAFMFKIYNFDGGITFVVKNSFVGCDIHGCYCTFYGLLSSNCKTLVKHISSYM